MTLAVKMKEKGKYTYNDYASWPDDERWELIDGVAYDMSPAPIIKHQTIVGNFFAMLREALKGKSCVPIVSPADVVFSEHDVVQPDIIVVCEPAKITEKNIQGAPDLVIEILSPSTTSKDRWKKKQLYEKNGVREYVIVDPDGQYVERYLLDEQSLFDHGEMFEIQQALTLKSLNNLEIPLWEVFEVQPEENPNPTN
ncbi:MAG: Uma2 family endonuclease [Candidatus Omnitrophota bacterium]|jgi:Uma2 family endonuclease|nr:MAG: Uma2 family endonuclease [Candidatus Omnitrophota bacterium]